ncbi:hypothetical protein XELAEV_18035048mg [Xenopus laevis]|uniref:Uncharacterized protein n=1 Tax=Xenopus laevis TaxID=8355 RepID=A0A974HC47_XENLA|nr:hypothetical protein XELAEV_18035048mg [Xenopus laevis]
MPATIVTELPSSLEEEREESSLLLEQEIEQKGTTTTIDVDPAKDSDSETSSESDVVFSPAPCASASCNVFNAPDPSCSISAKLNFMKSVQPLSDSTHTLPFQQNYVYYRPVPGGSAMQRKWLCYCVDNQKIYCFVCMAFCTNRRSMFIGGWPVHKLHVTDRIKEHEDSALHALHLASVTAYLTAEKKSNIATINVTLVNKHKGNIIVWSYKG